MFSVRRAPAVDVFPWFSAPLPLLRFINSGGGPIVAAARQIVAPFGEANALSFTPEEEAAIVAKITAPLVPALNNPAYTANHILPGSGSARESCGSYKFNRRTLDGCGSLAIMENCGRQSCPECYPRWASRGGKRAAAVIIGKMKAWAEYGHGNYGNLGGWILSPPQGWASSLVLEGRAEELRKAAATVAEVMGLRAAAFVFHALRQVGGTRGGSTVAPPPPGERLTFQDKEWYIAPHFHVLGVGFFARPLIRKIYHRSLKDGLSTCRKGPKT